MKNYEVKFLSQAKKDLDDVYKYIAQEISSPLSANRLVNDIENSIRSLSQFPHRGAIRKVGLYANMDYRQLFIHNFIVVYRICKEKNIVIIVTIKYSYRDF